MVVELAYDEDVLPTLSSVESYPEKDGDTMRFVASSRSSTTRSHVTFEVGGEDYLARYMEECELTRKLIEWQATWNRQMRRLNADTISRQTQLLTRFFSHPFIVDPVLGLRPPTARELLQPDLGRAIVLLARESLEDFGEGIVIDFLNAVRRFGRFVCENGAALPNGENVRQLWGTLVCPIGDGDIPKRKPKSDVFLPRIELMPSIFEASIDWAGRQRKQVTAWRTVTLTIVCFESGIRGVEAREASLADQLFDLAAGVAGVPNPICIHSAKGGPDREVEIDPFGFDMFRHWLAHERPRLVGDDLDGVFFPSSTGSHEALSSSSLTDTTGRLLDELKRRHLLHESFTFHATRKTYATHFVEKYGLDIDRLLRQCGWVNPAQLAVYLRPTADLVADQRARFSGAVGRRGIEGLYLPMAVPLTTQQAQFRATAGRRGTAR